MSTTTLYTLPGVPLQMDSDNIQANWPVFVQLFIARGARLCQFEHTDGLLASVLPDAEFLAWFAVLPDTVVPDNPGVLAAPHPQRPDRPLPHLLLQPGVAPDDLRCPYSPVAATRAAGPHRWPGPHRSRRAVPTRKNVYGNLPSDYLDEFYTMLDRAQTNDSVATVMDCFLTYFGMRAAVHANLSEYDKIKMLRKAFN
jgi:hypothetical protein